MNAIRLGQDFRREDPPLKGADNAQAITPREFAETGFHVAGHMRVECSRFEVFATMEARLVVIKVFLEAEANLGEPSFKSRRHLTLLTQVQLTHPVAVVKRVTCTPT